MGLVVVGRVLDVAGDPGMVAHLTAPQAGPTGHMTNACLDSDTRLLMAGAHGTRLARCSSCPWLWGAPAGSRGVCARRLPLLMTGDYRLAESLTGRASETPYVCSSS